MKSALCLLFLLLPSVVSTRVVTTTEHWQGEVRLTEPLLIEKDAKLIIAPGTQVFSTSVIEVKGALQARDVSFSGEDWPGLVLKNSTDKTVLRTCRIRGAKTGITVIGGAPLLTNLMVENNRVGIELRQKSRARVIDSLFQNNSRVGLFIKDESTSIVRGNRFEHQGKFGAYIYRAQPQDFSQNQFLDNDTGLMISHFGSNPRIKANRFMRNRLAIKVDRTAKPRIEENIFEDNQTALKLYRRSDPVIEANLFKQNLLAIHISFSSYPLIRHNNFIANKQALMLEFQSATWEKEKGALARQDQLASRGAFGGQKQDRVSEEQRRARQLDGTVDARENWWGGDETRLLEQGGLDMNPAWIDDGQDRPLFEEGGGEYPLDRVRWFPYDKRANRLEVLK
ncbi:MAG: right-handed parallel beta-helix repeat-containing protein [Geopsychrobacter sp.]|nr:right-handed parallel beta-helix repeat-containing protein [Geopsychrobacter sp.]